jgi:hypothetical protein
MMNKIGWAATVGLASFLAPTIAEAQIISPFRTSPFVSPFGSSPLYSPFNRGMGGNPYYPGFGTYGGVPLNNTGQVAVSGDAATAALTTGHATRFQYYSQYFLNQGGGQTPSYLNPFGMGTTGVPGPFGLGITGAVITPRVILGVQPRPNTR